MKRSFTLGGIGLHSGEYGECCDPVVFMHCVKHVTFQYVNRFSNHLCCVLPAAIRVRPAFAGEGRYFVRVPLGERRKIPARSCLVITGQRASSELNLGRRPADSNSSVLLGAGTLQRGGSPEVEEEIEKHGDHLPSPLPSSHIVFQLFDLLAVHLV